MFCRKSLRFAIVLLFPALAWGADCGSGAAPPAVRGQTTVRLTGPAAMVPNPQHVVKSAVEGDRIAHNFAIRNIGDAVLQIQKVESG